MTLLIHWHTGLKQVYWLVSKKEGRLINQNQHSGPTQELFIITTVDINLS